MKSTGKIAAIIAATAAVSLMAAASASAEERHRDGTGRDNGGYSQRDDGHRNNDNNRNESRNNGYRNEGRRDNHISERGRISRFSHERDGYRVWLDRGERSYWVPASRLGRRQLRVGIDIRLGGIFNGSYVDVDALGWPGDPYYNDPYYDGGGYSDRYSDRYNEGFLTGRVERVDYRRGTLLLRDDRSGRMIEVDMRATERRRGLDFEDVRRGARITLAGSWDGGYFHAYRIDGIRQY